MEPILGDSQKGQWTVIKLAGELDLSNAREIKQFISTRIEEGATRIALDVQGVRFMDSSTLGVLADCLKQAREAGGDLLLVGVQGSPEKLLRLTGLDRVFGSVSSLDQIPA